ncbi:hypothetical protein CCR75_006293 [Bremia lactucae]|uniref:Arf-GAP domain-containing protein n=1 Tax=Bremia lactucae TaxID=4779 RepID=A0A976FP93_BRELC|nr:hypothetical protein CCR75_006293 [Bremia lactucae]
MAAEAEAALNALRKLESNKVCINCGSYNRFGHQNICEKVHTFVCSNCKSAHQSFSMRVKSVSMSNWSMEEVNELRDENGGGNAAAERIWLGRWDESSMRKPTKEDSLDYYKQFINSVYNEKAFYIGADDLNASKSTSFSGTLDQLGAVGNLLDLEATDLKNSSNLGLHTFPTQSLITANEEWGNFAAAPGVNSSNDDFGAFVAAPAPTTLLLDDVGDALSADSDDFNAFTSAPFALTANSFDPFALPANVLKPSTASFDPFAPVQTDQSPILNQLHAAPVQKDFSVFDQLVDSSLTYGMPQHSNIRSSYGRADGVGSQSMGMQYGRFNNQQHPQPIKNKSVKSMPHVVPTGAPLGSRDPFAGLGLP